MTLEPVAGALVELVNPEGETQGATVSDRFGAFRLTASSAGAFFLRVDRIGFERWTSERIELGAGENRSVELLLDVRPVSLQPLRIAAEQQGDDCSDLGEDGAVMNVWQEARKSLRAAAATEDREASRFSVVEYERLVEPNLRMVREVEVTRRDGVSRAGFRGRSSANLSREGYVSDGGDGTYTYFAPDHEVLLSPEFLSGHCFGLRSGRDGEALVGIGFRPLKDRSLPDIEGTFWLDVETGVLRSVEYRFVRLPFPVEPGLAGGRIEFWEHPDGGLLVGRWYIRMPVLVEQLAVTGRLGRVRWEVALAAIRERGGEVRGGSNADGHVWTPVARVTGVVYDSVARQPLVGAAVRLLSLASADTVRADGKTPTWALTDESGAFLIPDVPTGTYSIVVSHPSTDVLGWAGRPTGTVTIPHRESVRAAVSFPTLEGWFARACPEENPASNVGAVAGLIRQAGTGTLVPDAAISVSWVDRDGDRTSRDTRSNRDGEFIVCGVPGGVELSVSATADGQEVRETVLLTDRVLGRKLYIGM